MEIASVAPSVFGTLPYSQGTLMLFSDTSDSSQKIFVEHTEISLDF